MTNNNLATILFSPDPFKENDKILLSLAQWQSIQSLVNDLKSLLDLILSKKSILSDILTNIPSITNPYEVLHNIDDLAHNLINTTIVQVDQLAGDLYDFGKKAEVSFQSVVKFLDSDPPNWNSFSKLLSELQNTSINYSTNVQTVSHSLAEYVETLEKHKLYLKSAKEDLNAARQFISMFNEMTLGYFVELIKQITSLLDILTKLLSEIQTTLPLIVKLEDAWNTIGIELNKAISNINIKDNTAPDIVPIVANINVAVNEWHDVANDAHNFMLNFHTSS